MASAYSPVPLTSAPKTQASGMRHTRAPSNQEGGDKLRIQRGRPRHAMEERGKLQKSTQEPISPPISNAKAPRRPAPAMARAARRRETPSAATSDPNGRQSKTQRANPFGDARRPLHHGIILLRRLCGMASPEDAASRHGSVQQPLPLKSGSDLTDLVHTLCGPIES